MRELKRRDFIKMIGLAVACPIQLLGKSNVPSDSDWQVLRIDVVQAGLSLGRLCKILSREEAERIANTYYQFDVHYLKTMCCYVGDIILLHYPGNFFMWEDIKAKVISLEQVSDYNCLIRVKAIPFVEGMHIQLFILNDSSNVCVNYLPLNEYKYCSGGEIET